jgi:hypothetical protein
VPFLCPLRHALEAPPCAGRHDRHPVYRMCQTKRDSFANSASGASEGRLSVGPHRTFMPGGDLLSQGVAPQVPSALAGLTSVFGMGTGCSPPLSPPDKSNAARGKTEPGTQVTLSTP